jgi:hypothetical protein
MSAGIAPRHRRCDRGDVGAQGDRERVRDAAAEAEAGRGDLAVQSGRFFSQ